MQTFSIRPELLFSAALCALLAILLPIVIWYQTGFSWIVMVQLPLSLVFLLLAAFLKAQRIIISDESITRIRLIGSTTMCFADISNFDAFSVGKRVFFVLTARNKQTFIFTNSYTRMAELLTLLDNRLPTEVIRTENTRETALLPEISRDHLFLGLMAALLAVALLLRLWLAAGH
jgi:hypothetical protein